MSRSVDLFCLECKAECGLDVNHGDATIAALISCRDQFAALGQALDREDRNVMWPIMSDFDNGLRPVMRFMTAHAGHALTWRDEYGDDGVRCCKAIDCVCGHRSHCLRLKDHEGECRSKP